MTAKNTGQAGVLETACLPTQLEYPDAIHLLKRLVINRSDVYAEQQPDGRYFCKKAELSNLVLEDHLKGDKTVGVYLINPKGQDVKTIGLDIDGDPKNLGPAKAASNVLRQALLDSGVPQDSILVEFTGMKGYRVTVFLNPPVSAAAARNFALKATEKIKIPDGASLEIFPKQDRVDEAAPFGNLVKLFFALHRGSRKRAHFVNPVSFDPWPWTALKAVNPWVMPPELFAHEAPTQKETSRTPLSIEDHPCWRKISEGDIPAGRRHDLGFAYARHLRDKGLSLDAAMAVMEKWWKRLRQPPETATERPWENIESAVQDAYRRKYAVGCKTIQKQWPELCDPNCEVRKKKEEEATTTGPAFVLSTGNNTLMLEEVYNSHDGFIGFAVWDGAKVETVKRFELDGIIYAPRIDKGLTKGVIHLPVCAEEYGSTEELIEEIKKFCDKYLDVSPKFLELAVWYILLSWVYDRVGTIAYLRAMGDYSTGKSRFLDVLGGLCYRAMDAGGATTAAAVARLIEFWKGTLILNEADWEKSDDKQEIVRILNEGFEKRRAVVKASIDKQDELIYYGPYGPKAIATRKPFSDPALESRCLTEIMQETQRDDIPPILLTEFRKEQQALINKLLMFRFKTWEKTKESVIKEIYPKMAGKLDRRLIQATITFSVLFADDPALFKRFMDFLGKYQLELTEQRAGTYEGVIINAIYELGINGKTAIAAGEIASQMQTAQGWEKKPDARTIGRRLRGLGITTKATRVKEKDTGKSRVIKSIAWNQGQLARIVRLFKKYVPDLDICFVVSFVSRVTRAVQTNEKIDLAAIARACGLSQEAFTTYETNETTKQAQKAQEGEPEDLGEVEQQKIGEKCYRCGAAAVVNVGGTWLCGDCADNPEVDV